MADIIVPTTITASRQVAFECLAVGDISVIGRVEYTYEQTVTLILLLYHIVLRQPIKEHYIRYR